MPSLRRSARPQERAELSWVLLSLLCACGKQPKSNEQPLGAPTVASAKAPPVASASAQPGPAPSASEPGVRPQLACDKVNAVDAARKLMNDWNAALNAHDTTKLEALYGPTVAFYGRDFTRDQVIASKRAALAASPAFKQRLSDVRIAPSNAGSTATFSKASGGKPVRASLDVGCSDGYVYSITGESDVPSDALAQAHESCEAAMYAVAFSLPQVTKEMANATDDAPAGGLSYPTEGKRHSAAIGFHHEDHFEASFFLTWENGTFTINQGDLPVSAAGQARVKAACPK